MAVDLPLNFTLQLTLDGLVRVIWHACLFAFVAFGNK